MAWALAFAGITVLGLAVLGVGLFMMHGLVYGFSTVLTPAISPTEIAPPDEDMYGWAFILAAGVAVVLTAGVARLGERTAARLWSPVLQGLVAAAMAAVPSLVVLLLLLGIDPVDFLSGL